MSLVFFVCFDFDGMFIARRCEAMQSFRSLSKCSSQVILFNGNVNVNSKGAATGENSSFINRTKTLGRYALLYGPPPNIYFFKSRAKDKRINLVPLDFYSNTLYFIIFSFA